MLYRNFFHDCPRVVAYIHDEIFGADTRDTKLGPARSFSQSTGLHEETMPQRTAFKTTGAPASLCKFKGIALHKNRIFISIKMIVK